MAPGPSPDDPFPSTRWSRVLAAGDPGSPRHRHDLDALARDYWQPICLWLQRFCRSQAEAAADLAQDFFVTVLDHGTVGKADPARGSFRAFLKTALRNFAIDRQRRERAQKRGGSIKIHSLDQPDAGEAIAIGPTPDQALDEAWRETLLQRALQVLEQQLRAADKAVYWAVFADYFLAAEPDLDYAALATRHAISTTAVSNQLMFAKRRFRALLHDAVAETVTDETALQSELAWLFAGVRV
ncbi:MAG: sigma-70 family RNA polymerase sigma factor [Planctomycetes bacterium]|nr:sigma-70 family RNA polymerase sigma factor [Planctomycetota bacterium]